MKFSDSDRERILSESFALLNGEVCEQPPPPPEPTRDELLAEALAIPVEDSLAKWRRDAAEREERRAMQRDNSEPEIIRKTYTPPAAASTTMDQATQERWDRWCDDRIRNYTDEMIEILVEENVREYRGEFCKLREQIDTLRAELANLKAHATEDTQKRRIGDFSEAIDLPPLQLRRVQ